VKTIAEKTLTLDHHALAMAAVDEMECVPRLEFCSNLVPDQAPTLVPCS
jgi:hypothetical protein